MSSRAYRLGDSEAVPDGVRRIARGRLDHAVDELRGKSDSSPEEAVHEARKDMKKLRALLRLARGELGGKLRRRENECFRDAARELSGVRDADVMLATLARLDGVPEATASKVEAALRAHRDSLAGDSGSREQAIRGVTAMLGEARKRVDLWPLEQDGFDALAPGFERSYRRGRRAMRAAREQPTDESLHEWRKRAKDLWYHLALLRGAWTEPMTALGDQAHELSDRLGDDHDLVVLSAFVRERPVPLGARQADSLERAVAERRSALQAEAFALGELLYAERPNDATRRVGRWWEASTARAVRAP